MAFEGDEALARLQVPYPHGLVLRARDRPLPVWLSMAHSHLPAHSMAFQGYAWPSRSTAGPSRTGSCPPATAIWPSEYMPSSQARTRSPSSEPETRPPPVRRHCYANHSVGMAFESDAALARCQVPHPHRFVIEPETARCPSAVTATLYTSSVWPLRVARHGPSPGPIPAPSSSPRS